jgi:hypothetical protein
MRREGSAKTRATLFFDTVAVNRTYIQQGGKSKMAQNFDNHAKTVPPCHFVALPILVFNLVGRSYV